MIRATSVIFRGDEIVANGKIIKVGIGKDGFVCACTENMEFRYVEDAIKYCLEN